MLLFNPKPPPVYKSMAIMVPTRHAISISVVVLPPKFVHPYIINYRGYLPSPCQPHTNEPYSAFLLVFVLNFINA